MVLAFPGGLALLELPALTRRRWRVGLEGRLERSERAGSLGRRGRRGRR
jgi:hypothetical protein